MKGTIYCTRSDRLAARLLPLLCGLRISRKLNYNFKYVWKPAYSYLVGENLQDTNLLFSSSLLSHQIEKVDPEVNLKDWEEYSKDAEHPSYEVKDPFKISALPGENPILVSQDLRSIFFEILSKEIKFKFQQLLEKFEISSRAITAIHIRRGDLLTLEIKDLPDIAERYTPSKYYDTLIMGRLEKNPNDRFLVFSDDIEERLELANRFPDNCSIVDSDDWPFDFTVIEEAMLDMLLMSTCGEVVGAKSAYNNLASIIGSSFHRNISDSISTSEELQILGESLNNLSGREFELSAMKIFGIEGFSSLKEEQIDICFKAISECDELTILSCLKKLPSKKFSAIIFERALKLAENIDSEFGRSYSTSALFRWSGDLKKSIDCATLCFENIKDSQPQNAFGMANHLGNLFFQVGDYQNAIDFYDFAINPESKVILSAKRMRAQCLDRLN